MPVLHLQPRRRPQSVRGPPASLASCSRTSASVSASLCFSRIVGAPTSPREADKRRRYKPGHQFNQSLSCTAKAVGGHGGLLNLAAVEAGLIGQGAGIDLRRTINRVKMSSYRYDRVYGLRPGVMHVWTAYTDEQSVSDLKVILSIDEQKRAQRFHHICDAGEYVFARALLRLALSHHLSVSANEWQFVRDSNGRSLIGSPEISPRSNNVNLLARSSAVSTYPGGWVKRDFDA